MLFLNRKVITFAPTMGSITYQALIVLIFVVLEVVALAQTMQWTGNSRPPYVREALADGRNLYYFGLGSNMLRSKLENRGLNGTKIDLLSFGPAIVPGYRLAFNMRGFLPPLEPGMGTLEPCDAPSQPLRSYHEEECHGALVLLTPENYEKVMKSEGISDDVTKTPVYEEVIVDAYPYTSPNVPVKAIALRARHPSRMKKDLVPSKRYMDILTEGAAELNLKPSYQHFLSEHPTEQTPPWLRRLAIHNMIFMFNLSRQLGTRAFSRLQSRLLYLIYVAEQGGTQKFLSNLMAGTFLFPGACLGLIVRTYYKVAQIEMPIFMSRFIQSIEDTTTSKKKSSSVEATTKLQMVNQNKLTRTSVKI